MRQKRLTKRASVVVVCILVIIHCSTICTEESMSPGSTLPVFKLNMPDLPEIDAYLGMKGIKTFFLSQIPAKLLVVEFFSVFCPICQENVPTFNRLYQVIKDDNELNKDIKMIGIALLSPPKEVAVFKEKFKVKFPIFTDPQQEIQKKTKLISFPLILVIDKNGKVIMSHHGMMKDIDAFLRELRKQHRAL